MFSISFFIFYFFKLNILSKTKIQARCSNIVAYVLRTYFISNVYLRALVSKYTISTFHQIYDRCRFICNFQRWNRIARYCRAKWSNPGVFLSLKITLNFKTYDLHWQVCFKSYNLTIVEQNGQTPGVFLSLKITFSFETKNHLLCQVYLTWVLWLWYYSRTSSS